MSNKPNPSSSNTPSNLSNKSGNTENHALYNNRQIKFKKNRIGGFFWTFSIYFDVINARHLGLLKSLTPLVVGNILLQNPYN